MPKIYAKYSPEVIVKMRKQAEEEERRKKESEATLADRLWPDAQLKTTRLQNLPHPPTRQMLQGKAL